MKAKDMTVAEYANLRGITPGAVRKAIMMGHNLPGVISRRTFGKSHVLRVSASLQRCGNNSSKKVA